MPRKEAKNVKIRATDNKAQAVETREPDSLAALKYVDELMQKAPGTRTEHITAQQAINQIGRTLQKLKGLKDLEMRIDEHGDRAEQGRKKIEKLQKQIKELKGKIK